MVKPSNNIIMLVYDILYLQIALVFHKSQLKLLILNYYYSLKANKYRKFIQNRLVFVFRIFTPNYRKFIEGCPE